MFKHICHVAIKVNVQSNVQGSQGLTAKILVIIKMFIDIHFQSTQKSQGPDMRCVAKLTPQFTPVFSYLAEWCQIDSPDER